MPQTIDFKEGAKRWRAVIRNRHLLARNIALQLRETTLGVKKDEPAKYDRNRVSPLRDQLRESATDEFKKRRRGDPGPLRIVTGLLLRSYYGGKAPLYSPWPLNFYERGLKSQDLGFLQYFSLKTPDGAAAVSRWGSRAPYAYVHEEGVGVTQRRYFAPAIREALPEFRARSAKLTHQYTISRLWGTPSKLKRPPLKR